MTNRAIRLFDAKMNSSIIRAIAKLSASVPIGLFIAYVILAISFRVMHMAHFYIFVEIGFYLIILAILFSLPTIKKQLAEFSPSLRRFLLCLLFLSVGSQLAGTPSITYPFVDWSMYTSADPWPLEYYEFIAVHKSGERSSLLESELPVQLRPFSSKLSGLLESSLEMPEQTAKQYRLFDDSVKAVSQLHPNSTFDDPIIKVIANHNDLSAGYSKPMVRVVREVNF